MSTWTTRHLQCIYQTCEPDAASAITIALRKQDSTALSRVGGKKEAEGGVRVRKA